MFHLLAYSGSVAQTADTQLTGLVDPVITRSQTSGLYVFQQRLQLMAALGMSATANRVKLSSPTLRQVTIPYMRPILAAARPASNTQLCWMGDQPFHLPKEEEVGPLFTSDLGAGSETAYVLLWVADNTVPIPPGPVITARATASTAATAGNWTLMNITLEQSLPAGNYALVGSEHISATAIAHRWALFNQIFRPGSLSHQAVGDIQDWRLLTRRLGGYGIFGNTTVPQVEVLCTAADASHTFYLQLIPISGQIVP